MAKEEKELDHISLQIKASVKEKFRDRCERVGSNMSVEIKKFIYNQIKEEG